MVGANLTERERHVLEAVVRTYVDTAVGATHAAYAQLRETLTTSKARLRRDMYIDERMAAQESSSGGGGSTAWTAAPTTT